MGGRLREARDPVKLFSGILWQGMAPVLAHSRGHTAIAHGLGERQSELGNSQGERLVDVRSTRVWGVMSRKYLRGGIMSQKTLVSFTDTKDSNIDLAEVSKNHP